MHGLQMQIEMRRRAKRSVALGARVPAQAVCAKLVGVAQPCSIERVRHLRVRAAGHLVLHAAQELVQNWSIHGRRVDDEVVLRFNALVSKCRRAALDAALELRRAHRVVRGLVALHRELEFTWWSIHSNLLPALGANAHGLAALLCCAPLLVPSRVNVGVGIDLVSHRSCPARELEMHTLRAGAVGGEVASISYRLSRCSRRR